MCPKSVSNISAVKDEKERDKYVPPDFGLGGPGLRMIFVAQ